MAAGTDHCTRCPAGVVTWEGTRYKCHKCASVWATATEYITESNAIKKSKEDAHEYLGKPLESDLGELIRAVKVTTLREAGGYIMNAYEETEKLMGGYKKGSVDYNAAKSSLDTMHTVMTWLSNWSDKVAKEGKKDDDDA